MGGTIVVLWANGGKGHPLWHAEGVSVTEVCEASQQLFRAAEVALTHESNPSIRPELRPSGRGESGSIPMAVPADGGWQTAEMGWEPEDVVLQFSVDDDGDMSSDCLAAAAPKAAHLRTAAIMLEETARDQFRMQLTMQRRVSAQAAAQDATEGEQQQEQPVDEQQAKARSRIHVPPHVGGVKGP
jgi:hypothetical protein